jgi:hypothetical protein
VAIGPFQPSDKVRIPWEVLLNGKALAIGNPRVQRLVLPDGTDMPGFPQPMYALKPGSYILELSLRTIGNYTVIMQGEFGSETIEDMEDFVIERPFGYPSINAATDE